MDSQDVAHIIRLFPEAAPPGHNEDNGGLLDMIVRALPADCLHMTAAACHTMALATIQPEDGQQPQVLHDDALQRGNLPALRWYWARDAVDRTDIETLTMHGHLVALMWAYVNGRAWTQAMFRSVVAGAINAGHLAILQWAHTRFPQMIDNRIVSLAAQRGHLHVVQWARAHEYPWDEQTCTWAARYGHLNVLIWARTQDPPCPWDAEDICKTAARGARDGYVDVLAWARANGCPWDARACAQAARPGGLPTLQWLRAQTPPCPWDEHTTSSAAKRGALDVLQWARAQDPPCPWYSDPIRLAEWAGYHDIVQWLRENGCPLPP